MNGVEGRGRGRIEALSQRLSGETETFRMRVEGVNTLHLYNRDQPVNVVWGNNRCLL